MGKQGQLDLLNKKWIRDCTCTLRKTATQAVLGNGSATTGIIFIGEAPGKKEDGQGIPFIGAAGKFLNELLASIHLKREDIYITNVVKYRPPENRDPSPEEILACQEWLRGEIRTIHPKLIIPLGRHAMRTFLPDEKISEAHGKLFQVHLQGIGHIRVLPLYHPAAALYNGSLRGTLLDDFKKIPKLLKK